MRMSRRLIAGTAAVTLAASSLFTPVASAQNGATTECTDECDRMSAEAAIPLLVLGGLAVSSHGPIAEQIASVNNQIQQGIGVYNQQLADAAAQFAGPVGHIGGALLLSSAIAGSSAAADCVEDCEEKPTLR